MQFVNKNKFNSGVLALREPEFLPEKRTIAVSGLGRSGTTAAISSVYQAGVPMVSSHVSSKTLDDWGLGANFDEGDILSLRREIVRRDQLQDIWAFKWHLLQSWSHFLPLLRNVYLIVMFRDPVSVTFRAKKDDFEYQDLQDLETWLKEVALWNFQLMHCVVNELKCPTLLVSYEKLISNPSVVLPLMLNFCGLPCNYSIVESIKANENPYTTIDSIKNPLWLKDTE